MRLTGVFVGVVLAGLALGWVLRQGDPSQAAVGERAPSFVVEVIDGGRFDLDEHLATDRRPLVLNLWASWCVPCRTEIPALSAFSDNRTDVRVLGVAVDDTERSAIDFAREIEATYPLALGTSEFEDAYPRIGLPVTYVIDEDGVITDLFNGILDEEILTQLVDD